MNHSLYSPSSAAKWMTCHAALAMEQDAPPDESSDAANEGSAAHELGALALKEDKDCPAYIGRVFAEHPDWPVTDDMAENVQVYVDYVRQHTQPGDIVMVEEKLPHGDAIGIPGETGTGDVLIISVARHTVKSIDLKYGRSPRGRVDAEGNSQLRLYSLGALEICKAKGIDKEIDFFESHIVQPRLEHIDEETLSRDNLIAWAIKARTAVDANKAVISYKAKNNQVRIERFTPSAKACQWCRAKPFCPKHEADLGGAYKADAELLKAADSSALSLVDLAGVAPDKRADYAGIDMDTLMERYHQITMWRGYCDAIESLVNAAANAGVPIPDMKLVAGSEGNRKWSDAGKAEAVLKRAKVKKDQMYVSRIITAPEADKLLKKSKPRVWKELSELIERPKGKPKLVHKDAPGDPIVFELPDEGFDDLDALELIGCEPTDDLEDLLA